MRFKLRIQIDQFLNQENETPNLARIFAKSKVAISIYLFLNFGNLNALHFLSIKTSKLVTRNLVVTRGTNYPALSWEYLNRISKAPIIFPAFLVNL